jgi:hypothetical protein
VKDGRGPSRSAQRADELRTSHHIPRHHRRLLKTNGKSDDASFSPPITHHHRFVPMKSTVISIEHQTSNSSSRQHDRFSFFVNQRSTPWTSAKPQVAQLLYIQFMHSL